MFSQKSAFFRLLLICLSINLITIIYLLKIKGKDNYFDVTYSIIKYNFTFNISKPKIFYNQNYNIYKISYLIQVFDSKNDSILPSKLFLHHNLRIICFLNVNQINITSLASIENDKYFKCIEFINLNEKTEIGFFIYQSKTKKEIVLINKSFIIHKNKYKYKYDKDYIANLYNRNDTQKLKKLYTLKPKYELKRNFEKSNNHWIFANLFNEYFCFCKGSNCSDINISQKCKYNFYTYLIDYNHYIYEKTDFLLFDFISKKFTSADVYPVFEKMINRNIRAHYLTEKKDVYKKYCYNIKYCDLIIFPNKSGFRINGGFLEKHFNMFLKLRQVLTSAGVKIDFINNLFHNIDYITYICIGHGVSYFKYYLYEDYYGPKNFDKLLIPNSEKLINVPIKYGWKNENLIKFNLPRWDKFNYINESINDIEKIKSYSIFIMFTWRELKYGRSISKYYISSILDLLSNQQLINNLQKLNLTLYFSIHHKLRRYRNYFKIENFAKYVRENDISECLSKTQLLITDYSSIIFDMIYRGKPYIIFIPDANDPKIKYKYEKFCYTIIKNFANNYFGFQNVFFDINSTLDKINYYIENNFKLETSLEKFYDEFNFTKGPFLNSFIDYLLKL